MDTELINLQHMVIDLNKTNSSKRKIDIMKTWFSQYSDIEKWLHVIYNKHYVFNVTSKSLESNQDVVSDTDLSLWDIIQCAISRKNTGHDLIGLVNGYIEKSNLCKDFVYNIIDRDLRCNISLSSINKAIIGEKIPEFKVALANTFDIKHITEWSDWFASHKLDGLRCLLIHKDGTTTCWSRTGKQFHSLEKLCSQANEMFDGDFVLDGEACILDDNGNENFQMIMKEYSKKNHQIESPVLKVFDVLTIDEFISQTSTHKLSERIDRFKQYTQQPNIQLLTQTRLVDQDHFNDLNSKARSLGWEGLIIRKDSIYKGKRSNDVLKVKEMVDAEFNIVDVEFGKKKIMNEQGVKIETNIMSAAIIDYQGYRVGVGSGWSDSQRVYYYNNSEELIGKTATIQYFEETIDKNGNKSLRFPVVKVVYDEERTV